MTKLALGLMSGTSADGLTVCAVSLRPFKIHCFKNYPYTSSFQKKLLEAYNLKAPQLSALHYEIGQVYTQIVQRFLKDFHLKSNNLSVIGSHGQTIYHGPKDKIPNTLQIGEPSFMAATFHCPVVSDFRAMDMALGGEGAPLMPFFDEYIWGREKTPVILLNIGGISNFSVVGKGIKTFGFDVGPGNTLIDLICQEQFHQPFDKNGAAAAKGTPDKKRVAALLKQPYFRQKPPKSLDKNTYGVSYVKRYFPSEKFRNKYDLIATATWFTASCIADAIVRFVPKKAQHKLVISGGGCYNKTLLKDLRQLLPHLVITTSQAEGIDPQAKESAAFALFGSLALQQKTNHCAYATGARKNAILGKVCR